MTGGICEIRTGECRDSPSAIPGVWQLVFSCYPSAQTPGIFEPPADRQLLILGQDLGAVGGFPKPNNVGYVDHVKLTPAGITTYLSLPELRGMKKRVNLCSGDLWAQGIVDNPGYANSVLAIGLHFVGEEKKVADGTHDESIKRLGNWIKSTKRLVFLRIGYEFDGSWNHYDPEKYREAFRRIVTLFREASVKNCAMVWQAATSPVNGTKRDLKDWYSGDGFVDWMGYSWFLSGATQVELTDRLVNFARARGKPVMVCESAPQGYDLKRLTKRSIFKGKGS